MYTGLKHLHLTLMLLSVVLFITRLVILRAQRELPKALKIIPHIVDTGLLASAIGLSVILQQYPFVAGWLTLKLLFVVAYFAFVFVALKASAKSVKQTFSAVAALGALLAAIGIAFSKYSIF